jgi:hypothetical protein
MDSADSAINNVDSSCKVAVNTLTQKLISSLNRKVGPDGQVRAVEILDNFVTAAKQMDVLWEAIKPEFSWSIVVPNNVVEGNTQMST